MVIAVSTLQKLAGNPLAVPVMASMGYRQLPARVWAGAVDALCMRASSYFRKKSSSGSAGAWPPMALIRDRLAGVNPSSTM